LDGVKAVAVLAVVAVHLTEFAEARAPVRIYDVLILLNAGVAIFFALSAFLLYRPMVASRLRGHSPGETRRYAIRRAARTLPAYWVALTFLGFVWPGLPGFPDGHIWKAYLLFQIYGHGTANIGIYPAWSLAVELSFYVFLPFLALFLGWFNPNGKRLRLELAAISLLAILAWVMRYVLAQEVALGGAIRSDIFLSLPGRMDWFVGGLLVAAWMAHENQRGTGWQPAGAVLDSSWSGGTRSWRGLGVRRCCPLDQPSR
jgi:peptidoglycan/LPS O-acetylase OafA/YrhL